LIIIL